MGGAFLSLSKREKTFFAVFALVVAVFLFVTPYILLPKIYAGRDEWVKTAPPNAVFLELWEIDTFEGGSASRARFLEKNAYLYQERTIGTYVLVRTLDLNQAKLMLEQGSRPDIVSYGVGAGELLEAITTEITSDCGVRADLLAGGVKNGKQLAIPWCMGGYVLCADGDFGELNVDNFTKAQETSELSVIGTGQNYNIPVLSLNEDEKKYLKISNLTQYQAYESYLKGNDFSVLLGTQRDFYRLNNKVNMGVMAPLNYKYLNTYTDLIQYFSITSSNENQINHAQDFIKFVTSQLVQNKLNSIGMFTVNGSTIYSNEYADFERALNSKLKVLNVFTPNVKIEEIQNKGEL